MFLALARSHIVPGAFAAAVLFAAGFGAGAWLAPNTGHPLAASAAPAASQPAALATVSRKAYPVEVIRVIDGDTFEARVRAWPGIDIATKVRLRGIDAPEMRSRCDLEAARAHVARTALAKILSDGGASIQNVSLDKYGGRVLADAATNATADIAAALLDAGVVRRYSGGRREPWC